MEDSFSILIVDDELPQLELIGGFLKKQGFEVALAESGERALERFRQESFDLVLTDQRMPNMSGLDLVKAVHAVNPETPVIVLTAYGSIETAVDAIKAGATDYLTKPLNLDELLHRIAKKKQGSFSCLELKAVALCDVRRRTPLEARSTKRRVFLFKNPCTGVCPGSR